jgi:tetratricopeptide (TPR) repeat protein
MKFENPIMRRATMDVPAAFAEALRIQEAGRLAEAEAAYRDVLVLAPKMAEAHNNLGNVLKDLGRPEDALVCYARALELKPELFQALNGEGQALWALGRADAAIAAYQRALDVKPNYPPALANLGRAGRELGRTYGAAACFSLLIEAAPDFPGAYIDYGNTMRELGEFDAAETAFEAALKQGVGAGAAWYGLSRCRKFTEADRPLVARMQGALETPGMQDRERSMLCFALGKALDDLGDYEAATRSFDEANRLERGARRFDPAGLSAFVDRQIAAFPVGAAIAHDPSASDSELPILIVGMPRSGTTLVEQIVASHMEAVAGGELSFWLLRLSGVMNGQAMDSAAPRELVRDYLALLAAAIDCHMSDGMLPISRKSREREPEIIRVTDKMPTNFLLLGQIHALFPKARIIHCRRDPLDTALSIYLTRFAGIHGFANDRAAIVAYSREYARLMAHWRAVLPTDRFIEIDYEALVAEPESVSRRLIEFCGLDWDPACLDFHNTDRPIATASAWQARQPIFQTSVERWRHYEPWLGELSDLRGS